MLKPLVALAVVALAVPVLPAAAAHKVVTALDQYEKTCADVLNFLPRIVRRETVAAIPADAHVVLHFICTGVPLNDFGNAAGLTRTIAANPALARELARWGLGADDVVAVQITGNAVQLYVHRT